MTMVALNTILQELLVLATVISPTVSAIDCYTCSSNNGTNPSCEDPFHPAYGNLERNCRQGMDGRVGLFPARYCTKIKGTSTLDGTVRVVRSCALETLDNMCGMFDLENVRYTGCILSCNKKACNNTPYLRYNMYILFTSILFIFVYYIFISS